MDAVMISLHPKYCELIASGKKKIEVRKTKPKRGMPFKCLIYATKGRPLLKTAGLNLPKKYPETNEYGVCDIPLPDKAFIASRMHLNRKQAKELAKKLNYFARYGYLKPEMDGDEK